MAKMITLTIDGQTATVPEGTTVVDAGRTVGVNIPVFCYHPKLDPVGMCRMCLVDIGRPVINRETGQPELEEDGSPKIQFGRRLETGCTTPVSQGMVVRTTTQPVADARRSVLEFLLTSHPLDCPICDKGGECPLQNLTLAYGPGKSRFELEDKMHLEKHLPLGELIFLDRERCIQCGRCVRFQNEIADEPVIGFYQRGRQLEINTFSDPGFDSVFSGNTTDICPVGALTTGDFRFEARPWEMESAASVCSQCPVGCNITFNVRREPKAGGEVTIQRVMPRQNEQVNEIWLCDKGRFGYHYTESEERLTSPLIRRDGELVAASWDEALDLVARQMRIAGDRLVALGSGRLSNEDLFNFHELASSQGGRAVLYGTMGGGDLVARYGLGEGSNLGSMGKGSAILVIASDLHEEAPIWWLRVKQAAKRGATLIVANARGTSLDRFAGYVLRYEAGQEASTLQGFMAAERDSASEQVRSAAEAFAQAENGVIFYGSDGIGLGASQALAEVAARLLVEGGHVGRANNGLVAVWPHANTQGAWEVGFRPSADLAADLRSAAMVYVAGADPAGDDPTLSAALGAGGFVVVQDLFLTETAKHADVVLPAQAYTEREGTYTSGERRVQRFYPAVPAMQGTRPDFAIFAMVSAHLEGSLESHSASLAFDGLAGRVSAFSGLNYQKLAEVQEQWPLIERKDLYYAGTSYENRQGLGVQLSGTAAGAEPGSLSVTTAGVQVPAVSEGQLLALPITRLYDQGITLQPSKLLQRRMATASVWMHPETAGELGLDPEGEAGLTFEGREFPAKVHIDERVPRGLALVPRSTGIPISEPKPVEIKAMNPAVTP